MSENAAMPTNEKNVSSTSGADFKVPEFKVSGAFGSHMVLQRDRVIRIFGFSDKNGSRVYGEFDNETVCAVVSDNRFTLRFNPKKASFEKKTMRIYDDRGQKTVFDDILIGDVWMIGGQSNAELNLRFVFPCDIPEKFDGENYRLFMQTQAYPYTHPELCGSPRPDVICPEWGWKLPDKETSLSFSALGFFIAKELSEKSIYAYMF